MPETAAFDELAREFFAVWFRFHPEAALATGVGDYGNLLAPQSDDDHAALGSWLETLIVALEELDHDALDPARRLDAELMFALARVEHRDLLERDWRRRDPLRHLPLTEIYRLTLLQPPTLRDDLLTLLQAVPAHLRLAITQLMPMAELIPPPVVAAAIAAAEAGPGYLRELARSRWLRTHCHGSGEIEAAAETAAAAMLQYAAALRSTIAPRAAGPCGCGAAHLGFLLRHRHQLTPDLQDCAAMLERLLQALAPSSDAESMPEQAEPRDGVGPECARQRALLEASGLLSLPAAPLRVAGGPACPRFAAADTIADIGGADVTAAGLDYMPDLTRGQGTLYVADGKTCTQLSPTALRHRCMHLSWGGLHTLIFLGGMTARSLPRLLAGGTSLTGGWPLALEEQVLTAGDEHERNAWRATQRAAVEHAALDLALHLGQLDASEARAQAARLGDADGILAGLIRRPGDALARVLGWQIVGAARTALARQQGAQFDLRGFHDKLLAQGPIPAAMALSVAHGSEFVEALTARLCSSSPMDAA